MRRFLIILILICLSLTACGNESVPTAPQTTQTEPPATTQPTEPVETTAPVFVDHAGTLRLTMSSATRKVEATVRTFIDGDTVHFNVPEDEMEGGVLKARFLAINTPESTGKIEAFGKAASRFTKEKLSAATSIIIESETSEWNADSTGGRYLVWVWYKTEGDTTYRNLNVEILQNGLAIANSAANNQYGMTCTAAINQARDLKLNIYSGQRDPDFYYGDAVELTLKELRTNIDAYDGTKVAFSGVISTNSGTQGVYIEDYDEESGLYYGIYIYYGHGLSGTGLDILSVGNECRIVGTVQYYEAGGSWQVAGLSYRMMRPDDPGNIQKLSDGHSASYVLTDADTLLNGQVTVEVAGELVTLPYGDAVMGTSVEMKGLLVTDGYTDDDGEMNLVCTVDGHTVTVRTGVLLDSNGTAITAESYLGKTIDVKGIVDIFKGAYQIKVFAATNITTN